MILFSIAAFGNAVVIAHRGNSGEYPENTLESFNSAKYFADYLEQDLQMTKDDKLVVFHDTVLDNVTNVKQVFPKERARKNGSYYVVDFTMDELKTLRVTNRYFILWKFKFEQFKNRKYSTDDAAKIASFEEVLDLVEEYNKQAFGWNNSLGIFNTHFNVCLDKILLLSVSSLKKVDNGAIIIPYLLTLSNILSKNCISFLVGFVLLNLVNTLATVLRSPELI